jgi:choline dehydrogenase
MRGVYFALGLPALVLGKHFDYIIVGAGPAGLVMANRLSEDPKVTVAVVEPGSDERDNALISDTAVWNGAHGTHVDWNYTSVPQEALDGRELLMHSGRAWGGSSAINGRTVQRVPCLMCTS